MRLVLVTGRTPRTRSLCVECSQPIGESYLKEFGSRQFYCDYNCYATVHSERTTAKHIEHFHQMKADKPAHFAPRRGW